MLKVLFTAVSLSFGITAVAQDNEHSDFKELEMSTYYLCQLSKGPNWTDADTPEHLALQERHLSYIRKLTEEGIIIVAGPFADGDDARGLAVYHTGSLEEAQALGAADPKVKAGHLQLKWYTWMVPKGMLLSATPSGMPGKTKTGRHLDFEAVLDMPVAEVFLLWSSSTGARKFFAPDANIDPVIGGRYEIIFDPENDPDGKSAGTYGAKILRYEKNRELAFEWTMPPFVAELNKKPLPTWVEITFEQVEDQPGKTFVSFTLFGFGKGEKWDRAYEFFQSSWQSVFSRLKQYCNEKADPWSMQ